MKHSSSFLYGACILAATICIMAFTPYVGKDKNDKPVSHRRGLNVTTKSIENVTATTADCIYVVQVTGAEKIAITASGVSVMKRGDKFSKKFPGRMSGADYKARISGLAPKSVYLVRAYATSAEGTIYGYELSLETKSN